MDHLALVHRSVASNDSDTEPDDTGTLIQEIFSVLRYANIIDYDELRVKWQSILAGRPNFGAGLMSVSSLLELKSQLQNRHDHDHDNSSDEDRYDITSTLECEEDSLLLPAGNMVQWVEKEYRDLLRQASCTNK